MKIVPASFKVLDYLDQQSLTARIEDCGRICYKSEDRITPESAMPFIDNVIKRGHNSVLEMGVVTMEVFCQYWDYVELLETLPKYLSISKLRIDRKVTRKRERTRLLITGSIRAFREMLLFHPDCAVVKAVCSLLNERHPYFFHDFLAGKGLASIPGIAVYKVPLKEVEEMPAELLAKHRHISVKFIVNRAIANEIVRHRPCSFLQLSQRYCNYASEKFGNEVTFIRPSAFLPYCLPCETCGLVDSDYCNAGYCYCPCPDESKSVAGSSHMKRFSAWLNQCESAGKAYLTMIGHGASPQEARTVLPNSCKTEIIVYANLEEWRHIFKLRCSKAADPSMREVMIPLREEFAKRWPEVFENDRHGRID